MKKTYIIYALAVLFLSAGTVLAQPMAPISGTPITLSDLETLVADIANFLIIVSALIVVIAIIWNGIKWAMAGDDQTQVKSAKDGLKAAIIGAIIIFGVGMIIATIVNVMTTGSLY